MDKREEGALASKVHGATSQARRIPSPFSDLCPYLQAHIEYLSSKISKSPRGHLQCASWGGEWSDGPGSSLSRGALAGGRGRVTVTRQ